MPSNNKISMEKLKKRLYNLEKEKQDLDAELLMLKQEVQGLLKEIDRLREPPLLGAVVIKVLDQEKSRVVVATSTGPFFVVNSSRKVKDKGIEPGMIVALNQTTYSIMEILPVKPEDIKKAKDLIFLTELTLKED
ncbi:MAG: hypothetical protein ACFFCY_10700 [Promethearchaeota archaeon]